VASEEAETGDHACGVGVDDVLKQHPRPVVLKYGRNTRVQTSQVLLNDAQEFVHAIYERDLVVSDLSRIVGTIIRAAWMLFEKRVQLLLQRHEVRDH
jgi:hypothetical protein